MIIDYCCVDNNNIVANVILISTVVVSSSLLLFFLLDDELWSDSDTRGGCECRELNCRFNSSCIVGNYCVVVVVILDFGYS